ncbi:hypothetical protein PNOK_0804000 [Pyrrhoderma noxium]|uniref:Uncharacterized protein n=1 Tax=Pyrrhoderma noxium TaxID=2282107 RepID=A0A286UA25_9AGAM|nr:hypothetical protein PNOK_0804000 [Pyrrhoderma noxium]
MPPTPFTLVFPNPILVRFPQRNDDLELGNQCLRQSLDNSGTYVLNILLQDVHSTPIEWFQQKVYEIQDPAQEPLNSSQYLFNVSAVCTIWLCTDGETFDEASLLEQEFASDFSSRVIVASWI